MPDRPERPAEVPLSSEQETGEGAWGDPDAQGVPLPRVPAYLGDRVFYRLVLLFLGLIALASVAAAFYFPSIDRQTPEALIAMGSAAVGALVSLLSVHGRPS